MEKGVEWIRESVPSEGAIEGGSKALDYYCYEAIHYKSFGETIDTKDVPAERLGRQVVYEKQRRGNQPALAIGFRQKVYLPKSRGQRAALGPAASTMLGDEETFRRNGQTSGGAL